MKKKPEFRHDLSRRDFLKKTGMTALALTAGSSLRIAQAASEKSGDGPLNILVIVTDQERHIRTDELPLGYRLPGHEKLMSRGVTLIIIRLVLVFAHRHALLFIRGSILKITVCSIIPISPGQRPLD